jgi:hypothetical protein
MLGLMKFHSQLHKKHDYLSIQQNILRTNTWTKIIFRLGGADPYVKFGELDYFDYRNFRKDTKTGQLENMFWLNLYDVNKFVLYLRHIKLIWYDELNNPVREEFVIKHCMYHGCMTTIDTKSHYIYGPKGPISVTIIYINYI